MSVKIDDVNLNDIGIRAKLSSSIPLSPETRSKIITIPNTHGAYDMGAEFEPLPLDLECDVQGRNLSETQMSARVLKGILLDGYGRPRTVKVSFDFEPDKWYLARLEGMIPTERMAKKTDFTLPLTAYDPHAYSNALNTEITWGSEEITFEYDYLLGHKTYTDLNITEAQALMYTVQGLALKPIIEISGSADSLSISTGDYAINLPGFAFEYWVIDCERYTVSRNGENAFNDVKLREFILMPGDNPIEITGENINITMRITFRDKWM